MTGDVVIIPPVHFVTTVVGSRQQQLGYSQMNMKSILERSGINRLRVALTSIIIAAAFLAPAHASELEITIVQESNGVIAEKGMQVSVHYQGRLTDGTVFDDSHKRGEPISFILGRGQVIPGWEQGIEGMTVGEKRTLTIPPELGYGEAGAGDVIPPNATLVFDVELMAAITPPRLSDATPQNLLDAQAAGSLIIDIRLPQEWQETGIIEGAHTITAFTETGALHPEFRSRFEALVGAKDTPFILYCRTGNRTGAIGGALVEQLGYTQATHLTAGIVGWTEDGKTTVPYQD
ncbi:MAG: FKBP-type peptidyl-prolyl cis-trans isomerase [Alphaproteobacteria bacterium]|nr:FKBP-type peptidyl-prolyl cis-trans isomerase [Alphaproteobacteria bacterium]